MEVHVLASGSSGNAVFIKDEQTNILVDAGISARRITASLEALGVAVGDLNAVFITHEHEDHVKGLSTLLKKYRIPVYAKAAAWQAIAFKEPPPKCCYQGMPDSITLGQMRVEPFSISHDAADPVGFNLFCGATKCSVATDLGFVTDRVKEALALSDILVLESNHDLDLLQQGSYPWLLKKRIMSNRGHLSNTDAAWTIARLPRKSHTHVFLAHLSKENNRPDLARSTVSEILSSQGLTMGKDVSIQLTFPNQTASLAL